MPDPGRLKGERVEGLKRGWEMGAESHPSVGGIRGVGSEPRDLVSYGVQVWETT